ncbi:uncharacterized protein METZ01_LOCUS496314, partial [marine metagenome]
FYAAHNDRGWQGKEVAVYKTTTSGRLFFASYRSSDSDGFHLGSLTHRIL